MTVPVLLSPPVLLTWFDDPHHMNALTNVAYVVAAVLFIFGLKGLTHPRTAVRGNVLGALGMLLAVVVTVWANRIVSWELIVAGVAVGTVAGAWTALKVPMTGMPQMVAIFNGFGGLASVLVAGAELWSRGERGVPVDAQMGTAVAATGLIGAVTFTGSMIAFLKLQELMTGNAVLFAGQKTLNALLFAGSAALGIALVVGPEALGDALGVELARDPAFWIIVALAAVLGVGLTLPIGGADMPVVIALLNSYSGLAAAATGFVITNNVLIIAGALVGASGLILTSIMCKAMNRSLAHVLFGVMDATTTAKADDVYGGKVKSTSADEIALLLDTARRVVIVPGYGMAVSQAQHAVRDVANFLMGKGVEVEFAIHPVAGRMPGHMNVLLAEADIPYELLKESDAANAQMEQTDVAIVIGANDVVNPLARTDPKSPIAGMPIINVDQAKTCIVIKRSLSPGFAGIPNPLFAADRTLMFFADGKKAFVDLLAALKEAA